MFECTQKHLKQHKNKREGFFLTHFDFFRSFKNFILVPMHIAHQCTMYRDAHF